MPTECFEYDKDQSCLLSYGIDIQRHAKFGERSLGAAAEAGARAVADSLVELEAFRRDRAAFFAASQNSTECGYEGIKRNFVKLAGATGEQGLFVFHFTGHTFQLKNGQRALAPADCDGTSSTCITARALSAWLTEADCRSKHVLITLDCCGEGPAAGIADALTTTDAAHPSLYVACASTANETSHVIEALGASPFAYCLCSAIKKQTAPSHARTATFPLKKVFDQCKQCSVAFSSLLVRCEGKGRRLGLVTRVAEPELKWFDYKATLFGSSRKWADECDSSQIGRFELLTRNYDSRKPVQLHPGTVEWLDSLLDYDSPLLVLRDKGTLRDARALDALLSLLMYSVASIQVACDPTSVLEPNLFIAGMMQVMGIVDMAIRRVTMSRRVVELCGKFYREVLQCHGVETAAFDALLGRVIETFGEEQEGGQNHLQDVGTAIHGHLLKWIPLPKLKLL